MISDLETTELPWEIVDNFSYTLKILGLINRTERHWWAIELSILLTKGPEKLEQYRASERSIWEE